MGNIACTSCGNLNADPSALPCLLRRIVAHGMPLLWRFQPVRDQVLHGMRRGPAASRRPHSATFRGGGGRTRGPVRPSSRCGTTSAGMRLAARLPSARPVARRTPTPKHASARPAANSCPSCVRRVAARTQETRASVRIAVPTWLPKTTSGAPGSFPSAQPGVVRPVAERCSAAVSLSPPRPAVRPQQQAPPAAASLARAQRPLPVGGLRARAPAAAGGGIAGAGAAAAAAGGGVAGAGAAGAGGGIAGGRSRIGWHRGRWFGSPSSIAESGASGAQVLADAVTQVPGAGSVPCPEGAQVAIGGSAARRDASSAPASSSPATTRAAGPAPNRRYRKHSGPRCNKHRAPGASRA